MTPYQQGYNAWVATESLKANPFPHIETDEDTDHRMWCAGWYDARDDAMIAAECWYPSEQEFLLTP